MAIYFSKLIKEIKPQIQLAIRNPKKINTKKPTQRYTTVKTNEKRKIAKS